MPTFTLYHGSRRADLSRLDPSRSCWPPAVFLTPHPDIAAGYARGFLNRRYGGFVYTVRVALEYDEIDVIRPEPDWDLEWMMDEVIISAALGARAACLPDTWLGRAGDIYEWAIFDSAAMTIVAARPTPLPPTTEETAP